jgi:hypothetical protein
MDRNKLPPDPHHLGVPSGASKMISKPMVHSEQTVHLCCAETYTISKQTKTSFHWTYITKEYDQVSPKPFPRPWYIWCKPCIYLAPRLKLSPNRTKWASNWFMSPRSTIKCVQNDIWAFGTFGANRIYLASRLTLSPNGPKWVSTWPTSHKSTIDCAKMISKPRVCLA